MIDAVALPAELKRYEGQIFDADAHEMMPAQQWEAQFGAEARPLVEAWTWRGEGDSSDKNHPNAPGYEGDIAPVSADIANIKGVRAPGAVDVHRRIEVMDAMGIRDQLMFPGFGLYAMGLLLKKDDPTFLPYITGDRGKLGERLINLYTEWAIGVGQEQGRVVPVVPIYAEDPVSLKAKADDLIRKGARAVWLSSGDLPGGRSPAHPDLDPFWATLAEASCVPLLHVGAETGFVRTTGWKDAPAFQGYKALSEFDMDPWSLSTKYMPYQNFAATMVNGGVFERHPTLMLGIIEATAAWVGTMIRVLDMWYDNLSAYGNHPVRLPNPPSYYVKKNIRVSVFSFEDIARYIEVDGLEDIVCFASDYPHVEGGKDMIRAMYAKIAHLDEGILRKFFVDNGRALLHL